MTKDGEELRQPPYRQSLLAMNKKRPSSSSLLNQVLSFLPILHWLPRYDVRHNLASDVIGGLTVGIMHVPQGIAYSSLVGVRPVVGLYTSLFAPIFYMIFGTSRHVSIGVFAVVSLMCGACNVRVTDAYFASQPGNYTEDEEAEARLDYAMHVLSALGLMIGILQIALAVLRLDFLISFLSEQVITGFMVGASVHVFVAQLDKLLGMHLPRRTGIGKLFKIFQDIFSSRQLNLYTCALSLAAISLLFIAKRLVDPLAKRVTKIPLPYELFLLITGAILSTVYDFYGNYDIKIIGVIPTGLPSVQLPSFHLLPSVFSDAAAISIVMLVVTISMAKLFAKKHNYEIDVRQEFYAVGLTDVLSSFFPVWPASTALARSLVFEAAGTKTQLAVVFSSILLICVIQWIGPFLELLPICLLSSVIVVALQGMFRKLGDLSSLWTVSRADAIIFLLTFLATVCLDIIYGLACGLLASLFLTSMRTKRGGFLASANDEYKYSHTRHLAYEGALFFMNTEEFAGRVRREAERARGTMNQLNEKTTEPPREVRLAIDLSRLLFIDYSGAVMLLGMISSLASVNVHLVVHSAREAVLLPVKSLPEWSSCKRSFFSTADEMLEESETISASNSFDTLRRDEAASDVITPSP